MRSSLGAAWTPVGTEVPSVAGFAASLIETVSGSAFRSDMGEKTMDILSPVVENKMSQLCLMMVVRRSKLWRSYTLIWKDVERELEERDDMTKAIRNLGKKDTIDRFLLNTCATVLGMFYYIGSNVLFT